jgi:broad specificity phosphatase PhoE
VKQKKTKGSSFRGLLAYLLKEKSEKEQEELAKGELHRKKLTSDRHHVRERAQAISKEIPEEQKRLRGRIIGGNMDGETIDELAEEFESLRALRPEIAKPVDHVSLSAARGSNFQMMPGESSPISITRRQALKDQCTWQSNMRIQISTTSISLGQE